MDALWRRETHENTVKKFFCFEKHYQEECPNPHTPKFWLTFCHMKNRKYCITKAQGKVEKKHRKSFASSQAMLGKYQSWTNANNLPDAALNRGRSLWSQNAVEDSRQKGKRPLCTWQNLCWAGAQECYSALTAETTTQLHCALQSVLLRHKE